MPNSSLDTIRKIVAICDNFDNYTTYIEISPLLYMYLQSYYEDTNLIYNNNNNNELQSLYGCQAFVNSELKNYDYRITRKENCDAE